VRDVVVDVHSHRTHVLGDLGHRLLLVRRHQRQHVDGGAERAQLRSGSRSGGGGFRRAAQRRQQRSAQRLGRRLVCSHSDIDQQRANRVGDVLVCLPGGRVSQQLLYVLADASFVERGDARLAERGQQSLPRRRHAATP